uniref:Poly [ADP-ribose] polymerase n=1 Tax=Petromyzon marinus TaxID=7757 RepID=S4RJM8_PETMA
FVVSFVKDLSAPKWTGEESDGETESDEFFCGVQVNADGETHRHPQLDADIESVREKYGDGAVQIREYGAIDDVAVDLHINVGFLDEEIATAWKVMRTEAVVLRLHFSLSQYLDGPEPSVDVFQPSNKDSFGIGLQLKNLHKCIRSKVTCIHYQRTEKRNTTLIKKLTNPLMALLFRPGFHFGKIAASTGVAPKSPSYLHGDTEYLNPIHLVYPSTCNMYLHGDSLCCKVAWPCWMEGDYFSWLSSFSRRTLFLTCEKKSVTLHYVCVHVLKEWKCIHLRSFGSIELSVRHSTKLNIYKSLFYSRNSPNFCLQTFISSSFRGFYRKAIITARASTASDSTCSSPAGMPKSSARRSVCSPTCTGILGMFIGSSEQNRRFVGNATKTLPILEHGFLVQTMLYGEQRIPTLNEFCVVCDEPHVFQNGPMLKPAVCARELCVFAFQTLGVMTGAAAEVATGPEVVDLLLAMCRSALESPRKSIIFDPYPSVVDPNDPKALAFNPKKKNYERLQRALDSIMSVREMTPQGSYLDIKKQMDKQDSLAHPLLQWVISSNRSHIVKLQSSRQLKFMHTPHQFLLLSSPPAKEARFRAAKKLYGSSFAFHGSHTENWHSILRNGLVNASYTKLQLHGAAYGKGIYLSPISSISFGYSGMGKGQHRMESKEKLVQNCNRVNTTPQQIKTMQSRFLQSRNLNCIALCEVITSKDLQKHGNIWVCPMSDHVCTRFFFVYEDGQVGDANINTQDHKVQAEILRILGMQSVSL